MTTTHADDLKPSELRTLERSIEAITDVEGVLREPAGQLAESDRRDQERNLKKAARALDRAERSLSKLPALDSRIPDSLDRLETLRDELQRAEQSLARAAADADQARQAAHTKRLALLNDPMTTDDAARMTALADRFRDAWQRLGAIDHRFTHGLFKVWDEALISDLAYTLANREALGDEAATLLAAYEPLTDTREGMRLLKAPVNTLREQLDAFESALPVFAETLETAQHLASEAYLADVESAMNEFERADKARDISALLNLNPEFPQWEPHRCRLQAQALLHQALDKPYGEVVDTLRERAGERALQVSERIAAWQAERLGHEAEALAAQQAAARARSEANARRAEEDRLAWEERRRRLDAEREARHQRLIQLRAVAS